MELTPVLLTREGFAPFGDVIETEGARHYPINEGTTERYHDLARVEALGPEPRVLVSIFVGQPRPQPIALRLVERHPLGSQAFIPLQEQDYLVVVAEAGPDGPGRLHAFRATGRQGVNYRANVWHHPLLVLEPDSRFLVIDRGGVGSNLEEVAIEASLRVAG
ncbi:MAG: ureidoglycolate lyase [Verrucomicrobia bacterium]|nr:ureidoglycolate lyase [Verrucomicrobiota bacterium]